MKPPTDKQRLFERIYRQLSQPGTPEPPELENPQTRAEYLDWRNALGHAMFAQVQAEEARRAESRK